MDPGPFIQPLVRAREVQVSPIRKLTPEVAGKIAAGEVIERPSSVVKELLENSLDASSRRISVALLEGGRKRIAVEDDGVGIPSSELPLAVQNFATSKISDTGDLLKIDTLGFRGEALASIRAVSRFTIRSRTRDEDVGREIQWSGNDLLNDSPYVGNPGTEVIVQDLFFNLPARLEFLSSGTSELRRINSLVESFSLAFPESGFNLIEGGRNIISLPPSTLRERVEVIFSSEVFQHMTTLEKVSPRLRVHGYLSLPNITRGNRSKQYYFINGRLIKDRLLSHAVHQAYRSLIPDGRFPYVLIFLKIPPDGIDINVHPTKAEIRFRNERDIHRLISSAVRGALKGNTISFREKVESVYHSIFPHEQKGSTGTGSTEAGTTPVIPSGEPGPCGVPAGKPGWIFHEAPLSLFEGEERADIISSGKLYWQLHQSYILIQIRGGMVFVDQHAAHERILFDRAKRNMAGEKPAIQSLLFPATIELSPAEYERYEKLSDTLPTLGFEVEPFGLRSIIIHGIPGGVRNWSEGHLLTEILGERNTARTGVEDFIKSFACRAAIKAGTKLSAGEMESLIDQLFATEFPFTCPHGRPTILRVNIADLERRFHRTVSSER